MPAYSFWSVFTGDKKKVFPSNVFHVKCKNKFTSNDLKLEGELHILDKRESSMSVAQKYSFKQLHLGLRCMSVLDTVFETLLGEFGSSSKPICMSQVHS